jgi:hypothetical protein
MINWVHVAVNEKPLLRGKKILPEYSAALISNSVVLRHFGGGFFSLSTALTTIPFPTVDAAAAWIEENRLEFRYASGLDDAKAS